MSVRPSPAKEARLLVVEDDADLADAMGDLLVAQGYRCDVATVARSYARDTTKGGHGDVIPIAEELVQYLRDAIARSPSELVFPAPDGSMLSSHTPLEEVLRRAMKHAGLVLGYEHVCRKKGCSHREVADDAALRHCPTHGMKLWPTPKQRPIRFHDLRHTTASLLMMAGANPAAVQRILRHRDPRITTEVYGHLAPGYLRDEIDRLRFAPFGPATPPFSGRRSPSSAARRSVKTSRIATPRSRSRRSPRAYSSTDAARSSAR